MPLGTFLWATVAPTAISIAVTLFALFCLTGWGLIATLRGDVASLKQAASQRDNELSSLRAELDIFKAP